MAFRNTQPEAGNIVILRFGGGYHTRTSEDEIEDREASGGFNFDLDLENTHLEPRKPFKKLATATNAADIRGFAQLQKQDGSIATLIQAGTAVYDWDGATTFTSKGTVNANAQLRGNLYQNFTLDEKVIITDLSLNENVKTYDGTTFTDMTHNLGGNFLARYCWVTDERAFFANVQSGTATPHLIVGSKRSDMTNLSTSNRPSTSLAEDDPFYLLAPDLRPINGMVEAFTRLLFSTKYGNMYSLTGSSAKDFAISPLYARSGATGMESVTFAGNDVVYGRPGVIESLAGAEAFGDVENDDFSRQVKDAFKDFDEFRIVYNPTTKRMYVWPDGEETIWVYHKSIHDQLARDVSLLQSTTRESAWVPWTTTDSTASFDPTTCWTMLDPSTKVQKTYFGDSSGNIYELEGSDYNGDAGATAIRMERLSKNYPIPEGEAFDFTGWVRYRSGADVTLTLVFEYGGTASYDQEISLTLPASEDAKYFNTAVYWSENVYWGAKFGGRIVHQKYSATGRGTEFRVRAIVESVNYFSISEIGIEFTA